MVKTMKQQVTTPTIQDSIPLAMPDKDYNEIIRRKQFQEELVSTLNWNLFHAGCAFRRISSEAATSKNSNVKFPEEVQFLRSKYNTVENEFNAAESKLNEIKQELNSHPFSIRQKAERERS